MFSISYHLQLVELFRITADDSHFKFVTSSLQQCLQSFEGFNYFSSKIEYNETWL